MDRRRVLSLLAAVTASQWVRAQPRMKPARIGYLVTAETSQGSRLKDEFRRALVALGYVEGRDFVLEVRSAEGRIERFTELAAELVRVEPDVIVAPGTPQALAARKATSKIPIVAPTMGDPVGDGLVATLARPGGNVTGLTFLAVELVGKRLELLAEAVPALGRVAVLWQPGAYAEATTSEMMQQLDVASGRLSVHVRKAGVQRPDEIDGAMDTMARANVDALMVLPSTMLFNQQARIAGLAVRRRLPAIGIDRGFADAGGLMSYGASISDLFRRGAAYVDKILKGARPGDLPVERPTTFELVINLKTPRELSLEFPSTIRARADDEIP
jgi:putative ABC transport system substrate-binding protein